ncbi:MAG TPA: aldehyde dehydrogenase family protein, partial [Lacipirellulaceae bacterium]|nr:aldehyde dehydrogenase family protein [Lacipirellulaceae bacterium]
PPAVERGAIWRRWADLLDRDRELLAATITAEEGKPLSESLGEVDFGNSWFRYYAEFDRRIEGEILSADRPNEQLWSIPQPVGVVSAIIPWNYPMAVAVRKVAPALIAGNSIVLKPHEMTPLSALELARLADEAGVPAGVVNVVTGPGPVTGEALVRNPIPQLITFTGSVATGKRIASLAAENVTVVSLELGGKAPFIVMEDCDLDQAVEAAVFSRFLNCGQVCICNERTYVHQDVAAAFIERFVSRVKSLRVGDPRTAGVHVGPKVSHAELAKVEQRVAEAVEEGAKVATGGRVLRDGEFSRGHWYEPTVLVDVRQDMRIMQDEVFGPVAPVMTFSDFEEAMALANDCRYGLAAYLFTNDMHRLMRAVRDLECGELYVNRGPGESIHGYHVGWKQSGIGGDDGRHGLEHYMRRKTVYVKFNG